MIKHVILGGGQGPTGVRHRAAVTMLIRCISLLETKPQMVH